MDYQITATVIEGKEPLPTFYGKATTRKQAQAIKEYLEGNNMEVKVEQTKAVIF